MDSEQLLTLFSGQPIPNTNAQSLRSFDPANASGEVRTQQSAIRSLVRKPTNSSEPEINR
jgi:hypothetical protein